MTIKKKINRKTIRDHLRCNLKHHEYDKAKKYESGKWDAGIYQTASGALLAAFDWSRTREGEVFWIGVYRRFRVRERVER